MAEPQSPNLEKVTRVIRSRFSGADFERVDATLKKLKKSGTLRINYCTGGRTSVEFEEIVTTSEENVLAKQIK